MPPEIEFDPEAELDLVRRYREGQEDAIDELGKRLLGVFRNMASLNARHGRPFAPDDLADVAHNAVVIVLRKLEEYRGQGPFDGWVYRVCQFEFMNAVRARRRAPLQVEEIEGADPAPEPEEPVFDLEQISRALERIGGVEADTIAMKHLAGLTFEEAALELDLPVSTVKTRYYRGMKRLRRALGGEATP